VALVGSLLGALLVAALVAAHRTTANAASATASAVAHHAVDPPDTSGSISAQYPWLTVQLPMASQPPNPCHLLTTSELAAIVGKDVDAPGESPLATALGAERGCFRKVEGTDGGVEVDLHTATAEAAAMAIQGTSASFDAPLPVLWSHDGVTDEVAVSVLGYPAEVKGFNDGSTPRLRVLTPTAYVVVFAMNGVKGDEATLGKLAATILQRVDPTKA
jgi:hypothetical protein